MQDFLLECAVPCPDFPLTTSVVILTSTLTNMSSNRYLASGQITLNFPVERQLDRSAQDGG